MKKSPIYLLLMPLLLVSCGKNNQETSNQKSKDKYEAKTISAYYLKSEYDTTVDIRYYNGGSIPYISLQDYHKLLYRGRTYQEGRDKFSIEQNKNEYTIEVDGGSTEKFDVVKNTLESSNLWKFKNTNLFGTGDIANASYDGLPFCKVKKVTLENEPAIFTLDFSKYNIKIYGDTNAVYVPISFASDLFSNENILAGAYNQKDLYFFNYTENEEYSMFNEKYYDPMFSNPIKKDYAEYVYNEFCLNYDNFQGRPGRSSLEVNYDLTNGLDAALESRPLGKTIKKYLKSTKLEEYIAGATMLGYLKLDGGHSYYFPTSERLSTGEKPKWMTDTLINKVWELVNKERAKDYKELNEMDNPVYDHANVYKARNEKLGKNKGAIKGTNTYTKDGDIAYIHIDGFMGEIEAQNEWKEYYADTNKPLPLDATKGGAVCSINYGVNKAHEDSEVKHIVVDLAANTGGSTDEMLYMICLLTGQNKLYTYNTLSKAYQTTEYEFDLNLDRVFDEKDNEYRNTLLQGKDITVLTSHNGFSCGGISPIYLHDEGLFTIGDNCGGGSCSIYMQFDGYGILNRTSCPAHIVTKNKVSIDVARHTSCDHVMTLVNSEGAADFSNLYDTTTLRSLIEAHYAK